MRLFSSFAALHNKKYKYTITIIGVLAYSEKNRNTEKLRQYFRTFKYLELTARASSDCFLTAASFAMTLSRLAFTVLKRSSLASAADDLFAVALVTGTLLDVACGIFFALSRNLSLFASFVTRRCELFDCASRPRKVRQRRMNSSEFLFQISFSTFSQFDIEETHLL